MLGLIILLPIIGSLFFFGINNEDKLINNFTIIQRNSIIKQIGLSTSLITLILTLIIFSKMNNSSMGYQFIENITPFGFIGVDQISIYYVLLTAFITPVALLSNWNDITFKLKYFVFSFLLLETLQIAFFCVTDLFMFYVYFESVLIPLFLIVGVFGASESRIRAAFLLFLYTLSGSLFMLLAIVWIIFNLGTADFNYLSLFDLSIDAQGWAFFAFFVAFAIKSPLYPTKWIGKSLQWEKLSNSGETLKLIIPNYCWKVICGWINNLCMVINYKISEKKIGYRGSKSVKNFKFKTVKEQRVDGSWCNYLHLRYTLQGF